MRLVGPLIIVLLAAPAAGKAPDKAGGPPESLVKACLAKCDEESSRCSRSAREASKQEKRSTRGRGRRHPGLRQCGCAYVGCKRMCERYAVGAFRCGGSSRPWPPIAPRSAENACKQDRDCTLMPAHTPCTCPPCGVVWRRAVSRDTLRAYRSKWARRRCAARRCEPCDSWVLGSSAYCDYGQCRVRP